MNEEHLRRCASAEWAEAVQKWIMPWVLDGIDLGDEVIEVGPGPGLTTDVLRAPVPRLTAVEIDQDLAASLAARLVGTNVEVLHADATHMPLRADTFTGAVCISMLHKFRRWFARTAQPERSSQRSAHGRSGRRTPNVGLWPDPQISPISISPPWCCISTSSSRVSARSTRVTWRSG